MELTAVIAVIYLLLCGAGLVLVCRRSAHPFRTGAASAGCGLAALGVCAACGLPLPFNLCTAAVALVLGVPGVAGLAALSLV